MRAIGLLLLAVSLGCGPDFRIIDGDAAVDGGSDSGRPDAGRPDGSEPDGDLPDSSRPDAPDCTTALGCVSDCAELFASRLIEEPFDDETAVFADWQGGFDPVVIADGSAQFGPHDPPASRYTALRTRNGLGEFTVCAEFVMQPGVDTGRTNTTSVGIRGLTEGVVLNLRASEMRIELNGLADSAVLLDRQDIPWPADNRFVVLLDRVGSEYVAEVKFGGNVRILRGAYEDGPPDAGIFLEGSTLEATVLFDRVVAGRVTPATRELLQP